MNGFPESMESMGLGRLAPAWVFEWSNASSGQGIEAGLQTPNKFANNSLFPDYQPDSQCKAMIQ